MSEFSEQFIRQYKYTDGIFKYDHILKILKDHQYNNFYYDVSDIVDKIINNSANINLTGYMSSFVKLLCELDILIEYYDYVQITDYINHITLNDLKFMVENNITINTYMRKRKIKKLRNE